MSERNDILNNLPDALNRAIQEEIEDIEHFADIGFTSAEIEDALKAVILKQYVVQ